MSRTAIVIGEGIIGLSCAYYLHEAGFQVTLLERGKSGHDCCSLGNAGMVVPSHFEPLAAPGMVAYGLKMMLRRKGPFGIRPTLNPDLLQWAWTFMRSCRPGHVEKCSRLLRDLNMDSRRLYIEMAEASKGTFSLEQGGLVMLCHSERAFESEAKLAEEARRLDLRVDVLDSREVQSLEVHTKLTAVGGVHFLDDCHLNPNELVEWLRKDLVAKGVAVRYESHVSGFKIEGRQIKAVTTGSEELQADEIVLAAGTWSGNLARQAGFRMPMQGGKGYSVNLPVVSKPKHCYILVEGRIAVTPMASGIRFAGTMEIVGDDLSVNSARYQGILENIPRYMPDFQPSDFDSLGIWSGLRPCSADGMPYLGRPRRLDNLIVATGHSMMGVSLAPVSGKIVAEIAKGEKAPYAMDAMAPDRFHRQ
ncbi:MAG: FAD-dependent oxidoreductase [Fimbriimonadaceae bacterium]|nr:FAD-dependent oxidoreductase [Fimbriimonadaceae bacterium]